MVVVVVHSALLADESEYYSLSQVLMRRHCMERVAAAVGLCTSSCLVLEEVGKTVYHHYYYSAPAVLFVVEALAQNSRDQVVYEMGMVCKVKG
jgi:hypothetical protein